MCSPASRARSGRRSRAVPAPGGHYGPAVLGASEDRAGEVSELPRRMAAAALHLLRTARAAGWRGSDPYDGLWWRWPAPLVGGPRRRQAIAQLHARSPVDIRRLYRRSHPLIPKALGVFASTGLRLGGTPEGGAAAALATHALEALAADFTSGEAAWGYHWDVQTRWSFYSAGSPNVVATAFAAAALLESGIPEFVARARAAARWVLDALWVEPEGFFAYHTGTRVNIHNASLLGARLVHLALADDARAGERVRRAVERSLADQRPDGSWPYGEAANLRWSDSFHTGYVLTCLDGLGDIAPARVASAIARTVPHYRSFFDARGRASLWANRRYPEDAHSAGTGLTTWAMLLARGLAERGDVERLAGRLLAANIRKGHAVHRRYRWGATTVTYPRWCDAHVALGLADASLALAPRG